MFVRYIAHEVRTPLNTAIMGLQVLSDEMHDASAGCQETLVEVRDSCKIAVEVLNELLTFDKLESGTLLLEKSLVNALKLINRAVKPFNAQVCALLCDWL